MACKPKEIYYGPDGAIYANMNKACKAHHISSKAIRALMKSENLNFTTAVNKYIANQKEYPGPDNAKYASFYKACLAWHVSSKNTKRLMESENLDFLTAVNKIKTELKIKQNEYIGSDGKTYTDMSDACITWHIGSNRIKDLMKSENLDFLTAVNMLKSKKEEYPGSDGIIYKNIYKACSTWHITYDTVIRLMQTHNIAFIDAVHIAYIKRNSIPDLKKVKNIDHDRWSVIYNNESEIWSTDKLLSFINENWHLINKVKTTKNKYPGPDGTIYANINKACAAWHISYSTIIDLIKSENMDFLTAANKLYIKKEEYPAPDGTICTNLKKACRLWHSYPQIITQLIQIHNINFIDAIHIIYAKKHKIPGLTKIKNIERNFWSVTCNKTQDIWTTDELLDFIRQNWHLVKLPA